MCGMDVFNKDNARLMMMYVYPHKCLTAPAVPPLVIPFGVPPGLSYLTQVGLSLSINTFVFKCDVWLLPGILLCISD